jgi:hypothetical protein
MTHVWFQLRPETQALLESPEIRPGPSVAATSSTGGRSTTNNIYHDKRWWKCVALLAVLCFMYSYCKIINRNGRALQQGEAHGCGYFTMSDKEKLTLRITTRTY